jgi:threonine aldolase
MIIDLRSDTVTKPTPAMLEAMINAKVGDDVFEEDPTVIELENKLAKLFGMEAGLFCPSGTMTNQIAIRIQTQPQDEVICDKRSHIYLYEGGGVAYNSLISTRLLDGDRGRITAAQVLENINPDNIYHPITTLVSLENTMNKCGGCYYSLKEIEAISKVCKGNNIKLHLDGARIFNALVETGEDPSEYGNYFDTISVCLSKGLGAPVGSVLLGTKAAIKKAKRVRKVLGGGMRQAGFLAAAGIHALDHHLSRLKEDHRRARILGENLKRLDYVQEVMPVDTNILVFSLVDGVTPQDFLQELTKHNILGVAFGKQDIRFVTHLDFNDSMLEKVIDSLNLLRFQKQTV